ncbi:MAG: alpha/beta hydrolase [Clostridiales bacterium]|nr:alpha/beta hydrolase [Candidatus Blautia equi]
MKIEVNQNYTYETMPEFTEAVEGAKEIVFTGEEMGIRYLHDVVYDHKDGVDLKLQIVQPYLFNQEKKFPCVVFIQGSAWFQQDIYGNVPNLGKLAERGYVCVLVQYRHSGIAKFPAQIVDAKNAIRYVKAHADELGILKDQVIVMGDSSGGHCSMMTGMTAKSGKFDEPVNKESCEIRGIINLYGAVDILKPDGFPITENHQLPDSPEGQMMGFNLREDPERGAAGVAKNYVNEDFPAVLILHGTRDRLVSCVQSVELYQALKAAGKEVDFYLVHHSDHGGPAFWTGQAVDIYDAFIRKCLEA